MKQSSAARHFTDGHKALTLETPSVKNLSDFTIKPIVFFRLTLNTGSMLRL